MLCNEQGFHFAAILVVEWVEIRRDEPANSATIIENVAINRLRRIPVRPMIWSEGFPAPVEACKLLPSKNAESGRNL